MTKEPCGKPLEQCDNPKDNVKHFNKDGGNIKGFDLEGFKEFQKEMITALEEHYPRYGNSWKEMSKGKLLDRLKHKFAEFQLTLHEKKLISVANLAMLLYIRLKANPTKSQNPDEMI